jgi:phage terminase small subunit
MDALDLFLAGEPLGNPDPLPAKPDLPERQRRFVEAYMGEAKGNATQAAVIAGYGADNRNSAAARASQLLDEPKIQEAIRKRAESDPLIATRKNRQQFWTSVMNDHTVEMKDRLRASELLGKCQADFVKQTELTIVADARSELQSALSRIAKRAAQSESTKVG